MKNMLEEIEVSLYVDDTDVNRKRWAKYIADEKIKLISLLPILDSNKKTATRFIWLVGDLCESNPKIVYPAVKIFFEHRHKTKITNYDRSLAKMFWLCGIPKSIEGEAVSEMFNWISDTNVIVSTKHYAIKALGNIAEKYPEIKNELRMIIEDQYDKNSISFKKSADKVLGKLNKE